MYAIQRMALLSAFFSVSTLCIYFRLRSKALSSQLNLWSYLPLFISGILAFYAKESAITLLFIIALIELNFFKFKHYVISAKIGITLFIIANILFALIPLLMPQYTNFCGRGFTITDRLMTQPYVILTYLQHFFWPEPMSVEVYNDTFPTVTDIQQSLSAIIPIVACTTLAFFYLIKSPHSRIRIICFGWLFFIYSHLIESSYFP
jgi:hypothetical protein